MVGSMYPNIEGGWPEGLGLLEHPQLGHFVGFDPTSQMPICPPSVMMNTFLLYKSLLCT